jgi:hypothetical protein
MMPVLTDPVCKLTDVEVIGARGDAASAMTG